MEISLQKNGIPFTTNLSQPIDISIPLKAGLETVNCFYAPPMEVSPVIVGDFVGSTRQGGAVNFMNVRFNPHGNGTHTECVGHIAKEIYFINNTLAHFHFFAQLTTLIPIRKENGDRVIEKAQIEAVFDEEFSPTAFVIRTFPNDSFKLRTHYSGANPPYLHHEAITFLVQKGVKHLLLDLPSVDKEADGGQLLGHKAFWQYPENTRIDATITELIYIPNEVKDGRFLLNIQIASFEVDASPSKPVLYRLLAKPSMA